MKDRIRVAYAGHDFFSSCLSRLLDHPNVEVVLCMTEGSEGQPALNVLSLASSTGARVFTGRPTSEMIAAVNGANIDLLVCAAYMYRVPIERLRVRRAVNVHPTLLPHGRGPNPLPHLAAGDHQFAGVTIHELTNRLDEGPILLQDTVGLEPDETLDELYLKLFAKAPQLLGALLDDVEAHFRDKRDTAGGSYWPQRKGAQFDASVGSVEEILSLHAIYGMFGFEVSLASGRTFRASLLTASKCKHEFPLGSEIAILEVGSVIALRDGLARLDRHGALPPVE